ncbi:MAG: putative secreted protein, partial [Labilithrix sp.]|nr:putative secreted protein [Labilithrix sp.]
ARASSGKQAEALQDIAAVRASEMATPEALGRAAVAEVILLAKNPEREKLVRALQAARPLFDHVPPRERALLRALRRMIEVRGRSVYREPARPSDTPRDEPLLGEWVSKIVPEAAAFVPDAERSAETGALDVSLPAGAPAMAGSSAIAQQASTRARSTRTSAVIGLWIVLIVLFLAIWQFLAPATPAAPSRVAVDPAYPDESAPLLPAFFVPALCLLLAAVFFGRIAVPLVRARRGAAAYRRALRALIAEDTQGCTSILSNLVTRGPYGLAATAELQLSALAERSTNMRQALALCDAGLARVSRNPHGRALHSDILVPELIAQRALVLAALGDEHQASAEIATLAREHPTFAFMTRSVFRVRLVQALRRLDHDGAARLARERTPELPLTRRDEMLADIVLALSGSKVVDGEVERIRSELSEDGELTAWIDFMAPNALAQLATRSQTRQA